MRTILHGRHRLLLARLLLVRLRLDRAGNDGRRSRGIGRCRAAINWAGGKSLKTLRSSVHLPRLLGPQFGDAGRRGDLPHRLGGKNPEGEGQSAGKNRQRQHEAAK
ncbi:hypothetical protein [Mesorhizobium sp.]|uniref:hypothetical protein n=1 Tax=Mesorhizobium sp. TaxID=1871066 RepID=UPI003413826D